MINKKISVLMGVYNCEKTLQAAIKSIQRQEYSNWELIICDDGSTDHSFYIAKKAADSDSRIIVLKNDYNKGLNKTLNRCFSVSSGDYIARMDGDDESMPGRFHIQVSFLEENPEFALVSSPMLLFDENGVWGKTRVPECPTAEQVVCGTPINHAPVMMRRECLQTVGGYTENPHMIRVEDVDLWIKIYSAGYRCYNMQTPLYRMRNDQNALNRRKYRYRINETFVRLQGCRLLHLNVFCYAKAFLPMIYGLIPATIRAKYRSIRHDKA